MLKLYGNKITPKNAARELVLCALYETYRDQIVVADEGATERELNIVADQLKSQIEWVFKKYGHDEVFMPELLGKVVEERESKVTPVEDELGDDYLLDELEDDGVEDLKEEDDDDLDDLLGEDDEDEDGLL